MNWLATLDDGQLRRGLFDFDSAERFNWHFVPRRRPGLAFKDMTEEQRHAADALLATGLSEAGHAKAHDIMQLEAVLRALGGAPDFRDPDNYALAVFGDPAAPPWAWRFEGHHLSLSFTLPGGGAIAVTPSFWGANPAEVPIEPHKGLRVLAREQDLSLELIRDLAHEQRGQAVIADRSLRDIVTGPGRADALREPAGLPLAKMSDGHRDLAMALVETFVGNVRDDLAADHMRRIREAGTEAIHFAWAGGLGDGQAHYYRLHGPTLLIEYDNTQNNANHIHSIWRDLTRDLGGDLLARHYRHGHRHHHHA